MGGLLPIASGNAGSTLLGGQGELGGIVASLVARGESRCCARWSFDGVAGEPERGEEFFGGMLCDYLSRKRMVAALLRYGWDGGWMRRFDGGQRLCSRWNVMVGVCVEWMKVVKERRHCDGGEASVNATIVRYVFTVVLLWLGVLYCSVVVNRDWGAASDWLAGKWYVKCEMEDGWRVDVSLETLSTLEFVAMTVPSRCI